MRLTFTNDEYAEILISLRKSGDTKSIEIFETRVADYSKSAIFSLENKQKATKHAHAAKLKLSKEKVENAVNLLRLENKKITVYSVAKCASISFNTAKKHSEFINLQESERDTNSL